MKPIDPNKIEMLNEATASVLRLMTPAQKLAIAFEQNKITRLQVAADVRRRHPDWNDELVQNEVALIMLSRSCVTHLMSERG